MTSEAHLGPRSFFFTQSLNSLHRSFKQLCYTAVGNSKSIETKIDHDEFERIKESLLSSHKNQMEARQ